MNIYAFVVKNMIFQLTGHADCDIIFFGNAAIAQSVVRNIGSVEVTSSILVSSSETTENKGFSRNSASKGLYFVIGYCKRITYFFSIQLWTRKIV